MICGVGADVLSPERRSLCCGDKYARAFAGEETDH